MKSKSNCEILKTAETILMKFDVNFSHKRTENLHGNTQS